MGLAEAETDVAPRAIRPLRALASVESGRKASWIFLNVLHAVLEAQGRAKKIHVILYNHVIHKSRVTVAWMAEFGHRLELHFLRSTAPVRTGSSGCGSTCTRT